MRSLAFHPAAAVFPLMAEAELIELAEDIRENGLELPIVLHQGTILDGRNRYLACQRIKLKPEMVLYEGDDPVRYVVSLNLKRRHLDESQRSMVGARLAALPHGGDRRSNQGANLRLDTPTQAEASELLGVSERSIQHARSVLENGTPDIIDAVDHRDLAVSLVANTLRRAKNSGQSITSLSDLKDLLRKTWRDDHPPPPKPPKVSAEPPRSHAGTDTFGVVRAIIRHKQQYPLVTLVPAIDKWTRLNILDDLPPAIDYLSDLEQMLRARRK